MMLRTVRILHFLQLANWRQPTYCIEDERLGKFKKGMLGAMGPP